MDDKQDICIECFQVKTFNSLKKNNKEDSKGAASYCKEHLDTYHTHDKCDPKWCLKCGQLITYIIKL